MYIFRWLMSHPIITAWILAALAILLNINMDSKSEHGDIGNGDAVSHVVKSGKLAEAPSQEQVVVAESQGNIEQAAKIEHKHVEESATAQQQESIVPVHSDSASAEAVIAKVRPQTQQDSANTASVNVVTKEQVSSTEGASPATSSEVAEAPNAAEPVSAEDLTKMSSEDLLKMAREAFWQNKKDKSASIYQALVKRTPSSLAYKGELANVLWHQNKQKESAALYAEIAMPLLKEGKSREVSNMLGFIGVFFPEKAGEIHRSMSE